MGREVYKSTLIIYAIHAAVYSTPCGEVSAETPYLNSAVFTAELRLWWRYVVLLAELCRFANWHGRTGTAMADGRTSRVLGGKTWQTLGVFLAILEIQSSTAQFNSDAI